MMKFHQIFALLVRNNAIKHGRCRRIHLTANLSAKKFLDSENDYASTVLHTAKLEMNQKYPPYAASAMVQDLTGLLESREHHINHPEKLLQFLDSVASFVNSDAADGLSLQDQRMAGFVTAFVQSVQHFSDAQLAQALQALGKMEDIHPMHQPNYLSVWTSLDNECLSRIANWNVDTLLHIADQWYPLRLTKQGKYVHKALWKISNRLRKLPPKQLVKTVFYINLTRVPLENMMDIEVNFSQNFEAFSIDDVAILCMGFFKTETPIRGSELLEKIYHKLITNLASIEDIALTAILKLLRYSSRIPNVTSMEQLLTAIVQEIPRLSILSCLHTALLGSDVHICHKASLELIVDKFHRNLTSLRLKDMERIAFVLLHSNILMHDSRDTALCRAILAELPNRVAEIVQYPKCYIALLHFLSTKNIYHPDFISAAFEERFLQLAYSKNIAGAGREAVMLDAFATINLRGLYVGNRFPPSAYRLVCKLTQDYLPNPKYKLTKSDRMLLDIQATFHTIRNEQCRIVHLLPHYQRPDVLFCLDELTGDVVHLDPFLPNRLPESSHAILTREAVLQERSQERNLRLVVIVVGSWNCYIRGERRRTGGYAMKLQQLKLLNYDTVEIPWYEWPYYSRADMQRYLTGKLAQFFPEPNIHLRLKRE